jgi:hypothetical protein
MSGGLKRTSRHLLRSNSDRGVGYLLTRGPLRDRMYSLPKAKAENNSRFCEWYYKRQNGVVTATGKHNVAGVVRPRGFEHAD